MCAFIIESLDRRGYLDEPIDLLAASMGVSVEDATQALYAVQTLSPIGTGARNLEECLILQLAEGKDFNRYTLAIVREHLLLLAKNDFAALARILKLSQEEARAYGKVIRSLNPIPSNGFRAHQDDNHPVIPDAVVELQDNEVMIHYNHAAIPGIGINSEYQSLLDSTEDPGLEEYLKQRLQQINKLRQDLDKRESTLLRLIRYILTVQRAYVLGLTEAPAPLSIQEIAEALDLHPSTISRAIRDKYITVDGRTIPLKNLLSAHIGKGIPMSRAMLRLCMERLIDAEDKSHPLSDESLSAALATMDIQISRRTVAAYREEFDIPPASRRRVR
jgi:RNA polymerase sigma-54 factor